MLDIILIIVLIVGMDINIKKDNKEILTASWGLTYLLKTILKN